MADTHNPKDSVGRGGSGIQSPEDRFFSEIRMKSRSVRDGTATFTRNEVQKILAQLLLDR